VRELLITTSRRPTQQIRILCRDLHAVLGRSVYINRGKLSLQKLVDEALAIGQDRLLLLKRWKGNPGKMEFITLAPKVQRLFPVVYLHSVVTQRELGRARVGSSTIESVVVESENSEVERLADALSQFLGIEKRRQETVEGRIYMSLEESLGHLAMITFKKCPEYIEIGPRLVIRHLVWSEREEKAEE